MDRKIRVGAVSYLNAKPLVYGLNNLKNEIDLTFDYPSKLASQLNSNEIDIGLVPVATIPMLDEAYIVSDYCIGAEKPVASVCLFSEVEVNEIKAIYLDYQSRTSVALLKILLKEFWKISPKLINASEGFENLISGNTAALIIGDRALEHRTKHAYLYDLAEAWIDMTGLPFVFAGWIANKKLPKNFIDQFNKATGYGLQHIPEIAASINYPVYDLEKYYSEDLDFYLNENKRKGLELFLQKILNKNPAT